MESNDKFNENNSKDEKGGIVFVLQIIAWMVVVGTVLGEYTGSDPAGNGMSQGLSFLFFAVPALIFILFSSFYIMSLKPIKKLYGIFAVVNILVLLSAFIFGVLS